MHRLFIDDVTVLKSQSKYKVHNNGKHCDLIVGNIGLSIISDSMQSLSVQWQMAKIVQFSYKCKIWGADTFYDIDHI